MGAIPTPATTLGDDMTARITTEHVSIQRSDNGFFIVRSSQKIDNDGAITYDAKELVFEDGRLVIEYLKKELGII